jgi:hypothetical protein
MTILTELAWSHQLDTSPSGITTLSIDAGAVDEASVCDPAGGDGVWDGVIGPDNPLNCSGVTGRVEGRETPAGSMSVDLRRRFAVAVAVGLVLVDDIFRKASE